MEYYLRAEAVWRCFRATGKRHILLTGERGSGKSTLFSGLLPLLGEKVSGYRTRAVPRKAVVLTPLNTGEEIPVAAYNPELPGIDHKMVLRENCFLQAAGAAMAADTPWLCIDELGYMEAELTAFQVQLRRTMGEKSLLLTLRKEELPFLCELREREDVLLIDLDRPYGKTGAVLMASGLGSRFGSNKLLVDFCGKPLFAHMLGTIRALPLEVVVVTRYREISDYCLRESIPVILHAEPDQSDTIRMGTEALEHCERILFCPADQPLLTAETLSALSLLGAVWGKCICRPAFQTTPGSPVLFPASLFPELRALQSHETGSAVIRRRREQVQILEVLRAEELSDIDIPDDLQSCMAVSPLFF